MARGLGSLLKFFRRGTKKIDEQPAQSVDEAVVIGNQNPSTPVITTAQVARPPVKIDPLKNEYTGPLQMGDKITRPQFGSQTYDWITTKGPGKFYADDWVDHLLDVKKKEIRGPFGGRYKETIINPRQFDYGKNYNGKNLVNDRYPGNNRGRVHLEELFDSGIAGFDKQGNLTSGLLFAAKQAGVKVSADDLTNLIKNSPVNRLVSVVYQSGAQPKAAKAIQDIAADFTNKTVNLKTNLNDATTIRSRDAIRDARGFMNNLFRGGDTMDARAFKEQMEFARDELLYLRDKVTPASSARINQTIGKLDQEIKSMKDFKKVENQFQENYTLAGGENYRELVVKMPGPIERNLEPLKSFGHYTKEKNPLYFSRFDTRYTQDGKKVLFIQDIQSDANQGLSKVLRRDGFTGFEGTVESTRRNPYAEEVAFNFLANARRKVFDQLKNVDETDVNKIRGLSAQAKQIDKATKFKMYGDQRMDRNYFPFLDSTQYGNHALRMHMRRAADEGYDYVAIAPYEKVAIRMHSNPKAGNQRFYGTAYGKGIGGKGEAIMPKLMKQNAKFHGSEAGTIKLAYSDPKKPYKVISQKKDEGSGFETVRQRAFFEHKEAHASLGKAPSGAVKVEANDPALYFDAFAIKVTPSMRGPVQSYSTGGLAVDIFKSI